MNLYTIGFTRKSAEKFFTLLRDSGVERLVDIRLHPGGQLAGFAKQEDLAYFLQALAKCDYLHLPELAPEDDILSAYRKDHDWAKYEQRFEALMDSRGIPGSLDKHIFETSVCCLLCSEDTPDKCHRRLVAERIARNWPEFTVVHLV